MLSIQETQIMHLYNLLLRMRRSLLKHLKRFLEITFLGTSRATMYTPPLMEDLIGAMSCLKGSEY